MDQQLLIDFTSMENIKKWRGKQYDTWGGAVFAHRNIIWTNLVKYF